MKKKSKIMGHKPTKLSSKVDRVKIILSRPINHAKNVPHHPHIKQEGGASSPQQPSALKRPNVLPNV
jgi:hypothetical protein